MKSTTIKMTLIAMLGLLNLKARAGTPDQDESVKLLRTAFMQSRSHELPHTNYLNYGSSWNCRAYSAKKDLWGMQDYPNFLNFYLFNGGIMNNGAEGAGVWIDSAKGVAKRWVTYYEDTLLTIRSASDGSLIIEQATKILKGAYLHPSYQSDAWEGYYVTDYYHCVLSSR